MDGGIRVWFREWDARGAGHGILRRVKLTEELYWGYSPSTEPVLKGVEVLLEVEGCYGGDSSAVS